MDSKNDKWNELWAKSTTPQEHAYIGDEWYNKYSSELMFLLRNAKKIADTGCGSAEIPVRIAPFADYIICLDFSQQMIEKAKLNIDKRQVRNIQLHCDNMLNIDLYVKEKLDAIYNYSVIQYLDYSQIKLFLNKCYNLLENEGCLLILDVPDVSRKDLFSINFFREEKKISLNQLIGKLFRHKFNLFKSYIKNPHFIYDLGIGHWYSKEEFRTLAKECNYNIEFYNPFYKTYEYRFHAKLTKKIDG